MNLKENFHIVWDTRKYGGKRTLISANSLGKYIGEKRAEFIKKNMLKFKGDTIRYSVQNKGTISVYGK